MSHLSKLLLLSCLVCAAACTVPSIEKVEADEGPAGCNDTDHKCPENFVCYENRCIKLTSDMTCRPGTIEDCDTSLKGECLAGSRECGAAGAFGACESKKKPAFDQCDGLDNDCNGQSDDPAVLNISKNQDADGAPVAVPLGGPGTGEPVLTLLVTTESGKVVTRTLSPDGTLRNGVTFPPTSSSGRLTAVTAASAGGLAAIGWLEQPGVLDGDKIRFFVALVDARGETLREPVEIPYTNGGALPNASELRLAINDSHILMLVRTTGGAAAPVPEIWALTVRTELVDMPVSTAFRLATPQTNYGVHATEDGTATQFLVAYESSLGRYVAAITNEGALVGNPAPLFRDPDTHSPFLVPEKNSRTDYSLFYVEYDATTNTSYLRVLVLNDGVLLSPASYSRAGFIERMRMTAPSGAPGPNLALWAWRDTRGSALHKVEVARLSLSASIVDKVISLPFAGSPNFTEVPIQLPGDPYYVVYQRDPAAPAGGLASQPLEVNVLPSCRL